MTDKTTELDALVVGAGFAGMYQLLCLRDRLGLKRPPSRYARKD